MWFRLIKNNYLTLTYLLIKANKQTAPASLIKIELNKTIKNNSESIFLFLSNPIII